MPNFLITSPDGKKFQITAPEGANQQDVLAYAQQQFSKPQTLPQTPESMADGMLKGPAKHKALPERGMGETAFNQTLQGATLGLSDEIMDRVGSGLASLYTGESYGDVLKDARGNSSRNIQADWEQNPGTSILSNVGGSLITGGYAATTKAGGAVGNSLRSGNALARIGKGALAGSASGGVYGAGTAEDGNRLEGAKQGAISGGLLGAAAPAVGAAVSNTVKGLSTAKTGAFARGAEELEQAAGQIKASSSQAYQAMRNAGAVINRPRAVNITNRVENAIKADGKLNNSLHANTLSVLDDFKQAARAQDFTLEDLDQWRQLFGQVAGNFNDKINARKASIAIDAIDDAVGKLSKIDIKGGRTDAIDALNLGRSEWARARKFEAISDIVAKADGDPNRLKAGLQRFVIDKKKMRGFTKEQADALRAAARNTTGEKLLKMFGKFGIDLGSSLTPGNTALPLIGATLGTPALTVGGTAARQGQKYLARGKAEQLLQLIEQNSSKAAAQPQKLIPQSVGINPALLSGNMANARVKP